MGIKILNRKAGLYGDQNKDCIPVIQRRSGKGSLYLAQRSGSLLPECLLMNFFVDLFCF